MGITITLPRPLEVALKDAAKARDSSVEEIALEILGNAIRADMAPSSEDVIAEIRALPAVAAPASNGSLADALRDAPEDPEFELEAWRRLWAVVEAEMKALSRANDLAEGRR
jgi:hypothetical protein